MNLISIDCGGTNLRVAARDEKLHILSVKRCATINNNPSKLYELRRSFIKEVSEDAKYDTIDSIGRSLCGIVIHNKVGRVGNLGINGDFDFESKLREDFPGAKIVAHEDEAEMLENPQYNLSLEVCGTPVSIKADIFVRDKDTLKVGNLELTFIHTPGHTKGGMCIYTAGHLFSGDTLFRQSIGRSDFYGGDYRALINSIKDRLYVFPDDTKVYPGHMGMTTIGDEKRGNPFV